MANPNIEYQVFQSFTAKLVDAITDTAGPELFANLLIENGFLTRRVADNKTSAGGLSKYVKVCNLVTAIDPAIRIPSTTEQRREKFNKFLTLLCHENLQLNDLAEQMAQKCSTKHPSYVSPFDSARPPSPVSPNGGAGIGTPAANGITGSTAQQYPQPPPMHPSPATDDEDVLWMKSIKITKDEDIQILKAHGINEASLPLLSEEEMRDLLKENLTMGAKAILKRQYSDLKKQQSQVQNGNGGRRAIDGEEGDQMEEEQGSDHYEDFLSASDGEEPPLADGRPDPTPYPRTTVVRDDFTRVETEPLDKQPVRPYYPMKNKQHGVALIISNEKFKHQRRRKGTCRDEENLFEAFRYLGYRVEVHHDCTKGEIEGLFDVNSIRDLVKDEDDSFVCCLLSHGKDNAIYGTDDKQVRPGVDNGAVYLRYRDDSIEKKLANSLSRCLTTKNRPKLDGKPKIFFVSACRVARPDGEREATDFIFCYSARSKEISMLDPKSGSHYIKELCKVLCKSATEKTLSLMHIAVRNEVSRLGNQVPELVCEPDVKDVYFFDDMFDDNIED